MTKRIDKILKYFVYSHPDVHINVFRSSEDPEVGKMLSHFNAEGSTALNFDTGEIDIQINDDKFRKNALYEELAHALQFKRDGNVEINSLDLYKREIEVSECVLERVSNGRISLNDDEVEQTNKNLKYYKDSVKNLGGS